jgi:hypothetical protein
VVRKLTLPSTDDVSLGPPQTKFPSSRNISKLTDFNGDKSGEVVGDESEGGRSRFFGDKSNRKSVNEKDSRDWTTVRDRRAPLGEDGQRHEGRYNRRDRDQDGERRNGYGEKSESRWGEKRQNGDRVSSWRDRERERKDRGWERDAPAEKEPEWMDDPAPSAGDDAFQARTQEEFQRWKEKMSGKTTHLEETETAETVPAKEMTQPKPSTTLKLEGIVDKPFGSWADPKSSSAGTLDSGSASAKSAQPKGKSSRFASYFNQPKEEPVLMEEPTPPPVPGANGAAEDEEGFNRVLKMLGGTKINSAPAQDSPVSPPPPTRTTTNGTRQKSKFAGFFDQTPKSPERIQSPPDGGMGDHFPADRGLVEEPGSVFGGRNADVYQRDQHARGQLQSNPMSPEPMQPGNLAQEQQRHMQHQRANDVPIEQPPSRGTATPDLNIQNLLANQRGQRSQTQEKNSEFLLSLLQNRGPPSRPSSQQTRQEGNFPLWLDQPPGVPEPHAPKPRAPPPPGLFEDQLLRNAPQDHPRHEIPQQMPGNEMPPQRRTSQRAPQPGFFDEQSIFLQQQQQQQAQQAAAQRRNFGEPPQQPHIQPGRRMSGHPNLPQMQIPQQHPQQFPPGPPQEFVQSPTGPQGPPPGFHPHMPRHPPGLNQIPNIFQAPQQPPIQQREPPGFGAMQGPGMQSPPAAPPGFFGVPQGLPPNAYGPMPGIRSPGEGVPVGMRGRGYDFDQGIGPRR